MPNSASENIDNNEVNRPFNPKHPSPNILMNTVLDAKLIIKETALNINPDDTLDKEFINLDSAICFS